MVRARLSPNQPADASALPRCERSCLPATHCCCAAVVGTSFIILCHLVAVLWLSWSDGTPGTGLAYTSANYTEVFSDRRTYTVLIDTFAFAFVSLAVALGIGIPIAWIAERTDFRAKTLLFTLMAIGLLIPGFAVAMGWLFLLHPRIGLLNQLFQIVFGIALAVLDHDHPRHGLGAGPQPRAARLHHDRRGVPLDGPVAGGGRRGARRRAAARAAARSPCGSPGPASWRRRSMCS